MPTTAEDIKTAYPLPVYNYMVEIGADAVAFSEVSGLDVSYETTTYKESQVKSSTPGPRVMHMPAQATAPTITLKKGVVKGVSVPALYAWIKTTTINQVEKKDLQIRLCDEAGKAVINWKVINAFPTKLEAPSFTADSNDAAIESLTLTADKVEITEA